MSQSPADGFFEFVQIVEHGSIARAADAIRVPRPTLSRRLAELESAFGVKLIHRTTRRLTLTEAGQSLYERARRVMVDAESAVEDVRRQDNVPRGLLRVSLPPSFGMWMLGRTVIRYMKAYPETELEVVAKARHVDLIAERVDVAVRAGRVRDPNLVVRRLLDIQLGAFAHPAWLNTLPHPVTLETLPHTPCIRGFARGDSPESIWPLLDGGQVAIRGRLATNDPLQAMMAAIGGQGVALLPVQMAQPLVRRGELVAVLEDVVGSDGSLHVVYPSREHLAPKVRAFVDMVIEDFTSQSMERTSFAIMTQLFETACTVTEHA